MDISLTYHKNKMKEAIAREKAIRIHMDCVRARYGDGKGIRLSYELSIAREKFYRFAYNLNVEKSEKWFRKCKDILMEILERTEDNNETTMSITDEDPEGDDVSTLQSAHGEGTLLVIGKQMTDFNEYGNAVVAVVQELKK